jgi:hypothetical protein
MSHLVSGAIIESISQRAAGKAIKREITGRGKKGLTRDDVAESIEDEYHEIRELANCEADDLRTIFPTKYSSIIQFERAYRRREDGN